MVINAGQQLNVLKVDETVSGSRSVEFTIQSDSVLLALTSSQVTTSVDVTVYSVVDGQEKVLVQFDQLTAATTTPICIPSGVAASGLRVQASWIGACSFKLAAKSLSSSSPTATQGQNSVFSKKYTIGTSAAVLIPVSNSARNGVVIRNYTAGSTLLVAETQAKLATDGYPILFGEVLSLDIAAGVELWAISDTAATDVRTLAAGA